MLSDHLAMLQDSYKLYNSTALVNMSPQQQPHPRFAAGVMKFPSATSIHLEELDLPAYSMDQIIDFSSAFETEGTKDDAQTVGDGAVNVRGRPSIKSRSGNWKASALIFGCEACERLAFYAISSNLVGYLTTMLREDTSVAVRNANNWGGTVRLTPIIGAIIADSYLGRFLTIGIFMCLNLLAQISVTASVTIPSLKPQECQTGASCPPATGFQVAFFYCSLYLMAIGAGGIKACVFPFASDQFDVTNSAEARRRLSCPNWWFVTITSGIVVAVSFLVYAQATLGWSWGYGIPAAVTAIWTLVYFFGAPLYRNQVIAGGPLTRVAQVLVCAARNWRVTVPADAAVLHEMTTTNYTIRKLRPHTPMFSFLDKAATSVLDRNGETKRVNDPWKLCTVTQVEEVKMLVRVLPIWLTNIMFWVVYAQVATLFLNQGTTLDRHIGPHFQIPAASMPLFLHLSICLFLPVYDKLLVPLARKFTGEPSGFTILQRIGIGQALSIIPISVAALVEVRRLRLAHSLGDERDAAAPLPMSIFWLLPQYSLFGITEVFLSVGQIEFFTDQAPESMRSLGNAMTFCAISLGNFGSSTLVEVVTKVTPNADGGWIGNDLNKSHMDYFYWLLTVLSVMNLAVYLVFARRYSTNKSITVEAGTSVGVGANIIPKSASVKRVHPVNVDLDF